MDEVGTTAINIIILMEYMFYNKIAIERSRLLLESFSNPSPNEDEEINLIDKFTK